MLLSFLTPEGVEYLKVAWLKTVVGKLMEHCNVGPCCKGVLEEAVRFQVGLDFEDLTEDTKKMYISSAEEMKKDRKYKMDMPKELETIKESCYIGLGPDFQRVLFRIGGRSPLVSYYLKMREITDGVSSSLTYKMNRTEICKLPPVAPTYQEFIRETRRLRREFREDYTVLTESACKNPSELRLNADMLMHELEFATQDKKPSSSGRKATS
ncbi:protein FAM227B-like isoform X4 [Dermochelys coriacea]|uniref:protein FAM227B-like isoform X4 n=1 Tax=Dermochelys coriacea TaxID=27794 RepID=UPI001CA9A5AB|nr:protein FAM227B-like isoform X4 [Dermochelys coriacea]